MSKGSGVREEDKIASQTVKYCYECYCVLICHERDYSAKLNTSYRLARPVLTQSAVLLHEGEQRRSHGYRTVHGPPLLL
jgi:hypothetical protein